MPCYDGEPCYHWQIQVVANGSCWLLLATQCRPSVAKIRKFVTLMRVHTAPKRLKVGMGPILAPPEVSNGWLDQELTDENSEQVQNVLVRLMPGVPYKPNRDHVGFEGGASRGKFDPKPKKYILREQNRFMKRSFVTQTNNSGDNLEFSFHPVQARYLRTAKI